jgi:hypothetical protein
MPIIYTKGKFYETPLYDHLGSNKQKGEKGRGMRKKGGPWAWGGGGREGEKGGL